MESVIVGSVWFEIMYRSVIGAIFCQVVISRAVVRVDPCITSGSQKWAGAAPIFIARAVIIRVEDSLLFSCVMSHEPVCQAFRVLESKISAEAVACVKKYFVAASVDRGCFCFAITGRIEIMFSSRPSQAVSQ